MKISDEYSDADVQALADVIADAYLRGIRAGSATLARMILDAGWRRSADEEPDPRGEPDVVVRAWCSNGVVDETAVEYAPWLADRQAAVDFSFVERVGDAIDDLVAGSDADDGSLEDAVAADETEGAEPAPWETYGDGGGEAATGHGS